MKICYHCGLKEDDPKWANSFAFIRRDMEELARPGTEVVVKGVRTMGPSVGDFKYMQYLHLAQLVEGARQAELEGYDCYIVGAMLDMGFHELREAVDIPVVFMVQAAVSVAYLTAPRYGLITPTQSLLTWQLEQIRAYHLDGRMAAGLHLGMGSPYDVRDHWKEPRSVVAAFERAARQAIAQGAGVLIPGFGTLNSLVRSQGVRDVDGIPILDVFATALKTAEFLVDLKRAGISVCRVGPWAAPSKQQIAEARQVYGIE